MSLVAAALLGRASDQGRQVGVGSNLRYDLAGCSPGLALALAFALVGDGQAGLPERDAERNHGGHCGSFITVPYHFYEVYAYQWGLVRASGHRGLYRSSGVSSGSTQVNSIHIQWDIGVPLA